MHEHEVTVLITQMVNAGLEPLITNDFSTWLFPHTFGVNLKDDPLNEPHETLELQIINCFLNSQSYKYCDDQYPLSTMDGLLELYVRLVDGNGIEKINRTINMPVCFMIISNRDNNFQCELSGFTSNYLNCLVNDNSFGLDISISQLEYDVTIQIQSPKQVISLSARDRVRRMNKLLFQEGDFE